MIRLNKYSKPIITELCCVKVLLIMGRRDDAERRFAQAKFMYAIAKSSWWSNRHEREIQRHFARSEKALREEAERHEAQQREASVQANLTIDATKQRQRRKNK